MPANPISLDQLLEDYWAGKLDVNDATTRRLIRIIETLKKKLEAVESLGKKLKDIV